MKECRVLDDFTPRPLVAQVLSKNGTWYKANVKCVSNFSRRVGISLLFSLRCMLDTKRLMNQVKLYWYTGSMLARSEMQKNRIWLE